jgi:hypothetical protein
VGDMSNEYKIAFRETDDKKTHGRPELIWENIIKIYLTYIRYKDIN